MPPAALAIAIPALEKVCGPTGRENATIKATLLPVLLHLKAL